MPIYWKTRNFARNPFDSRRGKIYDSALMSRHVPDFVNSTRATEGDFSITGQLAFSRMKRLLEVVNNPEGSAEVELNFSVDGQRIANVRGRVRADVSLTCQRCLEAMTVPIDVDVHLGIVASEDAAKRLPEHYDPLVVHGEQLLIAEVVEDEIILALPAIPRHKPEECPAKEYMEKRQSGAEQSDEVSTNPFAVLAQIKAKRK
jgi:uncharacterized protein